MKSKTIILLIFCLLQTSIKAENYIKRNDTIPSLNTPSMLLPAMGGGLVVAGSFLHFDHGGSTLGMDFKPAFNYKADEVLRFVPAVAMVSMKAFGIENRTQEWSELMVRSVASTAIMGITVESTKRLVGRIRPNGSDMRSFPSGHSATAFLTASLFAKEYGHLSPWYSVGAYGVATSTSMLRRIGDHHWMSDVMVGAGIGILSTEIAYALADIFYQKEKPRVRSIKALDEIPSSTACVYMTYTLPRTLSGTIDSHRIRSNFGYGVGMEGAHFFTSHLGISGRMGIESSQIEVNGHISEHPLDHVSFAIGPHFRIHLPMHFQTGVHVRGGYGFYPHANVMINNSMENISLGGHCGWGYEGGLFLGYLTRKQVSINLSANYHSWSTFSDEFLNQGLHIGISSGWSW